MQKTIYAIWDTILEGVKSLQKDSDKIVLYNDSKIIFEENFNYYYSTISEKFMEKDADSNKKEHPLDRHKTAAIIVCSILKSQVVGVSQKFLAECKDQEFLGNEKLAFEVAFSYMYSELKNDFDKGRVPYERIFQEYVFPQPYSCDRHYGEAICRDLCLSAPVYGLNPLLLANLMFFIEDYSFCVNGIKRIQGIN